MSNRLLFLNGLAIIAVVVNHAVYRIVPAMSAAIAMSSQSLGMFYSRLGSPNFLLLQVIDQIAIIGVPALLFVSGYFTSISTGSKDKTLTWGAVFNRIKFLIIPYLLWSILLLIINIQRGESYSLWDLANIFFVQGVAVPYYYIPMLITCYLIAPFVVPLARTRWKLLLFFSGLILLCYPILHYSSIYSSDSSSIRTFLNILESWKTPRHFFWFALGMVVGFHRKEFSQLLTNTRFLIATSLIVIFVLYSVEVNTLAVMKGKIWLAPEATFFYPFFALLLLLSYFTFEGVKYPLSALIIRLGTMSFLIFLAHYPLQEYFSEIISRSMPQLLNYPLVFVLLMGIIGLFIPVAIKQLVEYSPFRRYSKFVFG